MKLQWLLPIFIFRERCGQHFDGFFFVICNQIECLPSTTKSVVTVQVDVPPGRREIFLIIASIWGNENIAAFLPRRTSVI